MVLGKLPVPGRPTIWITVGQGPTAHALSRCFKRSSWVQLASIEQELRGRLSEACRNKI